MKRRGFLIGWVLAVAFFLTVLGPAAPALAAGDDFLPGPPPGTVTWSTQPLYDRYPVWNYVWHTRYTSDSATRLLSLANLVQVGKAWLLKLAIRGVEYALHLDVTTPLIGKAGESMKSLRGLLWVQDGAPWVLAGLVAVGALAMGLTLFGGRREFGLRLLAGAAVILVGSYAFLEVAPATVATGAGAARAVGRQVVDAGAAFGAPKGGEGKPSERLLRAAGEGAWQVLVLEPWIEGEFTFGAASKDAYKDGTVDGGKWLAYTPYERSRQYGLLSVTAQMQDLHQWDATFVNDYLLRRVVLSLVSFLLTVAYAGVLLLLAGGVLYYQLVLLVVLVLAPVWLLVALWHPAGLSLVRGAVVRAVGALLFQVLLMTMLTVLLLMVQPVMTLGEWLGWVGQGLLLSLLAAALYRYRFQWLQWGREAAPRLEQLRERFFDRHTAALPAREVLRESSPPAVVVLPQFREERPDPAFTERRNDLVASSGAGEAAADLAAELSRLRERMHPPADQERIAVLQRLDEVQVRREVAAASAPGGAPSVPPAGRPMVRPDQGQRVNEYRNR